MKPTAFFLIAFLACFVIFANAQPITVPKDVRFLVDSVSKQQLLESLNQFLAQKDGPNKANQYVLREDLPAMSALLDELKGMEKNTQLKDDHFYKPVLQNLTDEGNGRLLVQFSYVGLEGNMPALRASFRLIAAKDSGRYYFYTVLGQNTTGWRSKKIGFVNFRYKDTLNLKEAKAYVDYVSACNKRLNVKAEPVEYYDCDNFPEVLQVLGVDYKLDYSGVRYDDITGHGNRQTVEICGGYSDRFRFDRHDLWHDRLHMVLSTDKINRPVDEGCAYLYGGSWGRTWPEVLNLFKKYAADHPDADWLELYSGSNSFHIDGYKKYFIAYVINALIIQKIEKEKGFTPVMALLGCGRRQPDEENYFTALEKVSGITKADFSQTVWELMKQN